MPCVTSSTRGCAYSGPDLEPPADPPCDPLDRKETVIPMADYWDKFWRKRISRRRLMPGTAPAGGLARPADRPRRRKAARLHRFRPRCARPIRPAPDAVRPYVLEPVGRL